MMTKSQEQIVEDITRRVKDELRDADMKLVTLQVEELDGEEVSTLENVKTFMETKTEKTEKITDVLQTTNLHNKYMEWNEEKNKELYPNKGRFERASINMVETTNAMGRLLSDLNHTKARGKFEGKSVRGYGYLKYQEEADTGISVLQFMEKYTERTKSTLDRVSIKKLLPKFYRDHSDRFGLESFSKKLNRYGYTTKPAKETQKVEGRYGKEKIIKVGVEVPCILRVRLKNEFYREEWTQ